MSYDELLRDMERALVAIDASKPYRYEPTTSLPALSPQMQAALDAEAEMVASVVKRARDFATELDAARAEVERLRTRVGWLDHLDTPEGRAMHATEAVLVENEQLRADLREAVKLIGHAWSCKEPPEWQMEAWELLEKHKETP